MSTPHRSFLTILSKIVPSHHLSPLAIPPSANWDSVCFISDPCPTFLHFLLWRLNLCKLHLLASFASWLQVKFGHYSFGGRGKGERRKWKDPGDFSPFLSFGWHLQIQLHLPHDSSVCEVVLASGLQ